ncbi:MAG: chromosome segregation protein SMC [Gammaproteobacteria bacterium]|nr:chromosome segregation protein SMC [Gammaproteobacteria bacterium]
MRLSSIKLAGFKSFVDPQQLPLPSNLTGIVGPNGCGKSNIIDAVRWLLGETSMKELRSAAMEDVIFNGSKTRKPAGRASVELIFDNSDGTIGGPYAAYSEIAVKRELTRDGNSQYYLNGAKCLKRDVTDLFLGTGVAARSGYAIIEQGMVSRMIEAKPEELRQWLEEAAGISRYKERRRETESRIRGTRENLARLNDLRSELATRLEVLRKQAANAEKYKEYKELERRQKAELLALRLRALDRQGEGQEAAIAALGQGLEAARAGVQRAHEAQAEGEAAVHQFNQQLSERQARVYEAESAASRQEQSLQHAREMKALRLREIEQIAHQIADLAQRETREQARLVELTAALAREEAEAAAAEAREAQAQEAVVLAEEAGHDEEHRWTEFTQRSETPLIQAETERVRVQGLERTVRQAQERLARLQSEQSALDAAPVQESVSAADVELETLGRELASTEEQLQALDRQVQELRDGRAAAETALHEARQSLQGARGKLASLETLQQAALREDDAELGGWLRDKGLDRLPRLASALQVDPGWEAAVEHVLEGLLQAPLLPEFAGKAFAMGDGPKAGVTLLAQEPGDAPGRMGRLCGKVQGPAAVVEWLAGIHIAVNEQQAKEVAAKLGPAESVITPDGVWRGRHWLRYPRQGAEQSGVIARGVLLKQLHGEVEALEAAVQQREQALGELRARAQTVESQRREFAARHDQARGRQGQKLAFRQAQAVRLEQIQGRARQIAQELGAVNAALDQQTQEFNEARHNLAELEAVAQRLRQEKGERQHAQARARETLQQARVQLAQAQGARQKAQLQLAGRRSALEALRQALQDLAVRRDALAQSRAEHEREAATLDAPLQGQAEAAQAARAAVEVAREELRLLRQRVEAAEKQQGERVHQARQAEYELDAARERLQQAQLEFQGLSVRRQTLADQIQESGFVREDLLQALDEDATPEAWEEKLAALGRRIERLGAINLAAIQELEEAQQRETYLTSQHDDLHGALNTLEEAIRKIDAETKERFKITFEKVDRIFRDRFPRLFGGGEAYLELTGENLLETGVRVMARPPGKRNSSIQLLSGGEKAMTAVALLLALFQLNPAPFCMLDEVDAPLDDANVGRFVEVVREMSANVQFIIITHNKISMELANQLHGVTMQEPGVSRLVSVDVQKAVELAGKKEEAMEPAAV